MAPKTTAPAKKATPAKTPAKAVVKRETPKNALAQDLGQDMLEELLQDAGAGLEKATAADFALPFIHLMQKMSPQVDEHDPKYVEGAKAGKFLNTVTKEVFDSLRVIPVDFEKVYIEWIPRDQGGGFVAQYKTRDEAERNKRDDGSTQIVDTANHYVLLQGSDGEWSPAIISMTSTKLKASRRWVSTMGMVTLPAGNGKKVQAPTYARYYDVVPEGPVTNDKGSFFILRVDAVEGEEGWVRDANLREMAKDFRAQLQAGTKGADYSQTVDAELVEVDEDDDEIEA